MSDYPRSSDPGQAMRDALFAKDLAFELLNLRNRSNNPHDTPLTPAEHERLAFLERLLGETKEPTNDEHPRT